MNPFLTEKVQGRDTKLLVDCSSAGMFRVMEAAAATDRPFVFKSATDHKLYVMLPWWSRIQKRSSSGQINTLYDTCENHGILRRLRVNARYADAVLDPSPRLYRALIDRFLQAPTAGPNPW